MDPIKIDKKTWEYKELASGVNMTFATFWKIYEKDRMAARLYINSNETKAGFRHVVFIHKNVHVIVHERVKYGVSTTLRMYKAIAVLDKVYLNIDTGMVLLKKGKNFVSCCPTQIVNHEIQEYIISVLPWIEFIFKRNLPITFTTIVKNKLYNDKKLMMFYFNANYETSKFLYEYFKDYNRILIKKNNLWMENMNNLNREHVLNGNLSTFMDTLKMGIWLLEKTNVAWSVKRMKEEHDQRMTRINVILAEFDNEPLNIAKKFRPAYEFLQHHGCKVFQTTRELILEGFLQHHCVGTYANSVNTGYCMIMRYKDITVQLNESYGSTKEHPSYHSVQAKKMFNQEPTKEEKEELKQLIEKTNEYAKDYKFLPSDDIPDLEHGNRDIVLQEDAVF